VTAGTLRHIEGSIYVRKAVGYVRVSTVEQAEVGVSLEAQEHRIRAWCTLHDYELTGVKVDRGLSGGRADNRPALQEALSAVGRGDALIVYSLSRLARSTRDTLAIAEVLDRRNADLVSLSESIETTSAAGKMIFRLLAVLSEFERDVIAERTSMAMRHLQAQGRHVGGGDPYGFHIENGRLVPVEREQEAIGLALRFRARGMSLRLVSQELSRAGFTSRTGRPFDAKQVDRMINSKSRAAA
jgi:DNA invertase Pin-like site-specific DNA recombinase